MIETSIDLHTHSSLTDGIHTPREMATLVASTPGLAAWGLSDHVRSDSDWVDDYVARVRRLDAGPVHVLCGVEAKLLDESGRLDLPAMRSELDYVLIADHQFPGAQGPIHPRDVTAALMAGSMRAVDVVEALVTATVAAAVNAPAYPIAAHLFSLLPKVGVSEDSIGDRMLDEFAAAAASVGLTVEVNEKWRCPSPRVVSALARHGVALVAGSDAHRREDIGRWSYVNEVLDEVDEQAARPRQPDIRVGARLASRVA